MKFLSRITEHEGSASKHRFLTFIAPAFCTSMIFVLMSPILLRKQTIAETLHCNGDLRFFGDPFPELLVEMKELRKTPKPSKSWTYEDLLFRNMKARIKNLIKPQFWKLLWQRWICRGCSCRNSASHHHVINYVLVVFWLPVCLVLVDLHVVPLFSVWANYVRTQAKATFLCSEPNVSKIRRVLSVPMFFMQLVGIVVFILMMWNLLLVTVQFFVFISIDVLRNAATTLSKVILLLAIFIYIFSAFADFEDGYRELKSVTIGLCIERAEANVEKETEVVVKLKPYEPLLVRTKDGEVSIPRRIFYDICKVYRPYTREVIATFGRLFATFALIFIVFSLIVKFQIFEEFSGQWETMLTICTVALPSMLRMLRSSHYRDLSDRRRESNIRAWLQKITTTRKVRVDLNRSVKIAIGEFLLKVAEKKA